MVKERILGWTKGLLVNAGVDDTMRYLEEHYSELYPDTEDNQDALRKVLEYIRETDTDSIDNTDPRFNQWEDVINFLAIIQKSYSGTEAVFQALGVGDLDQILTQQNIDAFFFTDVIYDNHRLYEGIFSSNNKNEFYSFNVEVEDLLGSFGKKPLTFDYGSTGQLSIIVIPKEITSLTFEQVSDMFGALYNWFIDNSNNE